METTGKLINCKACNQPGTGNYCGHCGEPYAVHRITLKHMLHEVTHLLTHFDKGFTYSVKQLVTNPGKMQADYIAGKRSLHQKPFSMFFLCGTIAALTLYWINKFVLTYHADGNEMEGHFFQHYFVILQMCIVPIYTLVVYLSFGRRYNYAEYLVVLLYNTSILFLFICFANLLKLIFGNFETGYIELCFVLLYNIYTYLNLFSGSNKAAIVAKTLLSSVICFAVSRGAVLLFTSFIMPHN